jgi:hypothetical protein
MRMLFRPQRGSLEDAMKEVIEVSSLAELEKKINWPNLTTKFYCHDHRIGWNTWIVMSNGTAIGYANGEMT